MTKQSLFVEAQALCPKCGSPMVKRKSQFGEFYGCTKYPNCKGTMKVDAVPNNVQQPVNPNVPQQPQRQQQPNVVNNPIARKIWFLATMVGDGIPVVVTKTVQGWEYMKEDGTGAEVPAANIAKVVKSVAGEGGQKISDENPRVLFKKFRELNGQLGEQPAENAEQVEDPNKVQGRIPANRISPQQKEIEESFLNTPSSIMINALAGSGKAQPLDSKLLTPQGWITMREVSVGDYVYGSDGKPHFVTGVFPQGEKEVFEVEFSDGSKTECCDDHLWLTETKADRDLNHYHKSPLFSRSKIRKTSELRKDLLYRDYPKHYIPLVDRVEFSKKETIIDPYLMGILLGDGSFRTGCISYSSIDQEIIKSVNSLIPLGLSSNATGCGCDYRIAGHTKGVRNPVVAEIKNLKLWNLSSKDKYIPNDFKFNDINGRISILQGLMDTDGFVGKNGHSIEFSTISKQLAEDVSFLSQSLGGTAKIISRYTNYTYKGIKKKGQLSYRVYVKLPSDITPFRLSRKKDRYKPSIKYHAKRTIIAINSVGIKECQCISINSNDSLYVTDNCILTHNTTMLRHLASYKDPNQKWLYLVFNKKNQVEASSGKGKFPNGVEVKTSHSFLGQVLGRSADLGAVQLTDLWNQGGERISVMLDAMMEGDNTFPTSIKYAAKQAIKQVASLSKAFAILPSAPDAAAQIDAIITKYDIDMDLVTNKAKPEGGPTFKPQIIDKVLDLLHYCLPGNSNVPQTEGMRDHDDTLWYASISPDVKFPRYDVVLADEVQDFNTCQTIMLKKLAEAGARIVAVGDPNQCQPAGTLISMTGKTTKPIEEIEIGDEVVTYNSKKSYFPGVSSQGRKIINKACREYEGELITIKTKSKEHKCTPNHRCVVKFNADKHYVLYLMTKGSLARVGIAKIKYFQAFGPAIRATSEGADRLWVLDVFSSEEEARIAEFRTWNQFGLPGMIFKHNGQKTGSQILIDKMYATIGDNISKAQDCLSHFGRDFNFPFWTKEQHERYGELKQNYIGSKKSFITQACNLLPDVMQIRTFDGESRGGEWETISISREKVICPVYSLEVEPTEDGKRLYIANGIVTHNSIYMFRGADAQAFQKVQNVLGNEPKGNIPHDLPVNYRSGRNIINYVNQKTKVKNLVAGRDFDGEVTEGVKPEDALSGIANEKARTGKLAAQTAFLARTNAPLVGTALSLMKSNVDFVIIGRDFSKELVDHMKKVTGVGRMARNVPIRQLVETLSNFMSQTEEKYRHKISKEGEIKDMKALTESLCSIVDYLGANNFEDRSLGMRVTDNVTFMDFLKKKFAGVNVDDANEAEQLKSRDPLSFVTLTSAHRSKGLEFDRVFILEPNLFPHPKSKTPDQLDQEENAKYVAFTRAMKQLHVLAPSEDKKKKKEMQASSKTQKKSKSRSGWYKKAKKSK